MFENIIGQSIVEQLKLDIKNGTLPASLLFCGPESSAKGTAALELARVLSCEAEQQASWNCQCPSCQHHRTLSHPDLLVLGTRNFRAEIASCQAVFLLDMQNTAARTLFIRSVRKLLLRFSPVLWDGEPKISKLSGLIDKIDDSLNSLSALASADAPKIEKIEKLCKKIVSDCADLESEGISLTIPAAQIRRASYWLRMTPFVRRKTLIIENADKMNDAARNSLLKILEEPPQTASIVLVSAHYKALLATILSRVRPYHFARRSAENENAVLKRIFRQEIDLNDSESATTSAAENPITQFQNSFLPASRESLTAAAAFFWSSVAAMRIVNDRKRTASLESNKIIVTLGSFCAPLAESGGFSKHELSIKTLVTLLCSAASDFKPRSLFPIFIELLYDTLLKALRNVQLEPEAAAEKICINTKFKRSAEDARSAVEIFNQDPSLALNRLVYDLT